VFVSGSALTLDFSTYDPVDNVDSFTIALNDFAEAISFGGNGFTFGANGLSEGEIFSATSGAFTQEFQITYAGNDGNDIVIAAVPEPSSVLILLGGCGALLGLQRTRRRR
jgi:hypothetical protein